MSRLDDGIKYLKKYNNITSDLKLSGFEAFRALMNITMPDNLSNSFYKLQDEIIKEEYSHKKIKDIDDCISLKENIYLINEDITLLKVDAIVNACNNKLLGCFVPLHNCIDNAIHSFAGLEIRRDLLKVMTEQGKDEPTGKVKVTKGYNLPAKYVFHTVGPIINKELSEQSKSDLRDCYLSCLKEAVRLGVTSIAFPCISTGIYGFPKQEACYIALETVSNFLKHNKQISVIFVTYDEKNFMLYKEKGRM